MIWLMIVLLIILYLFIGAVMAVILDDIENTDDYIIMWPFVLLVFILFSLLYGIKYLAILTVKSIKKLTNNKTTNKHTYNKKRNTSQINNFHNWIEASAKEAYPKSKKKQKAYKTGIYALLDKIDFDYDNK